MQLGKFTYRNQKYIGLHRSTYFGTGATRVDSTALFINAVYYPSAVVVGSIKALAGVLMMSSTLTGAIRRRRNLAGAINATATLSAGGLKKLKYLAGALNMVSTLSGGVTRRRGLSGVVAMTGTLTGLIALFKRLAGGINMTSILTGSIGTPVVATSVFTINARTDGSFNTKRDYVIASLHSNPFYPVDLNADAATLRKRLYKKHLDYITAINALIRR